MFLKRNANWIDELSSVTKKCNDTIHHSIKMTPIDASKKKNEDIVFFQFIR